jgi:hydrogenase maturation protease
LDPVRQIADAVLYEGYVLWPYRRSALKNQRRWTFGGVYPPAHSAAHPDDRPLMRTECLIEGGERTRIDVAVRFLQVVERSVWEGPRRVDELRAGDERHVGWDEATERELGVSAVALGEARTIPVAIPAGSEREALAGSGAILRSWHALEGAVHIGAQPVLPGLHRLTVSIANTTPWEGGSRDDVLRRTFCSTHTVLRAAGGAFVSLTDPPEHYRAAAAECRNEGAWPVLAGAPGDHSVLLSSPIILEDHPRIAPESPGDLFDGGEIDQLLVLNILAMTDEEKEEMRAADPRTREILERTEALTPEELMRLNGAIREFGMSPRR